MGNEKVAHYFTQFKSELEEIRQFHHLRICLHNSSDWGTSRMQRMPHSLYSKPKG